MKNQNITHTQIHWPSFCAFAALALIAATLAMFSLYHLPPTIPAEGGLSLSEFESGYHQWEISTPPHAKWFGWTTLLIGSLGFVAGWQKASECRITRYAVLSTTLAHVTVIGIETRRHMTDTLGHVNYISTIRNIDACRDAIMARLGWTIERLSSERSLAFVMKETSIKYKREILLGDTLEIIGVISQQSPTTIVLSYEVFTDRNRDRPSVVSKMTMPLIDLTTRKPTRIPEWIWDENGPPPPFIDA